MTGYAHHPFADIFPMLGSEEREELAWDVAENGLRERIVIHDGMILDGRNRYRACLDAKLFTEDDDLSGGSLLFIRHFAKFLPDRDGDPLAYVLSKNLHRRHLSESQRAMVAAKIEQVRHGGNRKSEDQDANLHLDREAAAKLLNVSKRTVAYAKDVVDHGAPELQKAVEQGEIKVSAAAEIAKLPEPEQKRLVEVGSKEFHREVKKLREIRTEEKRQRRAEREADLAAKQMALPARKYGVIYADPEWEHVPWSPSGMIKAAANHYPVSPTEEIAKRPIATIAATDAVLFLWAVVPMLPDALTVMQAWGFTYKSHIVWEKIYPGARQGMGYWSRINHELLLIGTRGTVPAPAPGSQPGSVIEAPFTGRHSEKPEIFAELIERFFPNLPKIELNRRGPPRPGWDAWGNEVEEFQSESNEVESDPISGRRKAGADAVASRVSAGRTADGGVPVDPAPATIPAEAGIAEGGGHEIAQSSGSDLAGDTSAGEAPDDLAIPAFLDRSKWLNGAPPRGEAILTLDERTA